MNITILHDQNSEPSRAFISGLGVEIPEGDDVAVAVGSDAVRIVSDQARAVEVCPAFPGYPTVLIGEGETRRILPFPASWAAVREWAANPPAVERSTTMSRYAFSQRFASDEMIGILAAQTTDAAVALFIKLLDYAQDVDLTDVNLQSAFAHMVEAGLLTQDRANEILTP